MSSKIPQVPLNQGGSMPQFGLGVWQMDDEQVLGAEQAALDQRKRIGPEPDTFALGAQGR